MTELLVRWCAQGRLVVGLGVGFASVAAPVLIAEMAREHNRGK